MNTTHAIVLGFVQGITEFLPVSSTGHLRIVPAFLGWEDPGAAFTAVTQLGTMAAILVFFRADIARIVVAWVRGLRDPVVRQTLDSRIGWYVAVGTIPIGIFGFLFRDQVETGARNLKLIGAALIVLGLVLLYAEHVAKRNRGHRVADDARRHPDRRRAGVRADPGRVALRRHDHGRAVPRPRPHVGGPLLLSALDPGRRAQRPARAAPRDRGQRARAPGPRSSRR